MHRLRMYLAAVAALAVIAASGSTFASGAAGGGGAPAQANAGDPPQFQTPRQGLAGSTAADGASGRANPGSHTLPRGPRPPFAPPRQPAGPGPEVTCFALSMVSGTIAAINGSLLTIVRPDGRALTLALALDALVTAGGVPVPPSVLAPGEAVSVTVTCQGLATAVNIAG
jgi:hypothetical protein